VEAAGSDLIDSVAAGAARLGRASASGFQGAEVSHAAYRRLRRRHEGGLRDVGGRVTHLRVRKDEAELDVMRRAAAVTDGALEAVVSKASPAAPKPRSPGACRVPPPRRGVRGVPSIVATGGHARTAHAIPGPRVIAAGELVINVGARVDGYPATSRAPSRPQADEELAHVRRSPGAASRAAVCRRLGRADVDEATRSVIAAAGYGAHFGAARARRGPRRARHPMRCRPAARRRARGRRCVPSSRASTSRTSSACASRTRSSLRPTSTAHDVAEGAAGRPLTTAREAACLLPPPSPPWGTLASCPDQTRTGDP